MEAFARNNTRRNCASPSIGCSPASRSSVATNQDGPLTSSRNGSGTGRTAASSRRFHQTPRSGRGCGRGKSPTPRQCRRRPPMPRGKRKRSRKSYEGWRRRYLGDLRHMLCCCKAERLPPANIPYLKRILLDPDGLPKPREVAERVKFTYEQQQRNRIYTVPAIDKTKAELAELRRAKDAHRKMLARRKAGKPTRGQYRASVASKKLWLATGMKKSTYYYRLSKNRTAADRAEGPLNSVCPGDPVTLDWVRPCILTSTPDTPSPTFHQASPPQGFQGELGSKATDKAGPT